MILNDDDLIELEKMLGMPFAEIMATMSTRVKKNGLGKGPTLKDVQKSEKYSKKNQQTEAIDMCCTSQDDQSHINANYV